MLGGIVYREASELPGGAPHNGALALLLGGVLVGCGALLATRVPARPAAYPRRGPLLHLDRPRAVVALLAPDVLVTAAVGLSAPFLPLYLQHRGFAPVVVARTAAVALLLAVPAAPRAGVGSSRRVSRAPAAAHLALGGAVLAMGLDVAVGLCLAALAVFRQAVTSASAPVYSALLHTRTNAADSAAVAAWRMLAQSLVSAARQRRGGRADGGPPTASLGGSWPAPGCTSAPRSRCACACRAGSAAVRPVRRA